METPSGIVEEDVVIYVGRRARGIAIVEVHDCRADWEVLNPRHDVFNHSPSGFEWGYFGSGPAQLALALLYDHLKRHRPDWGEITLEEESIFWHQRFKFEFVGKWDQARNWELSSEDLEKIVAKFYSHDPRTKKAASDVG